MLRILLAFGLGLSGYPAFAGKVQPDQTGIEKPKPERPPVCEGGDGKPPERRH